MATRNLSLLLDQSCSEYTCLKDTPNFSVADDFDPDGEVPADADPEIAAMNKPLEDWDNAYIESLDATERTTLELKGSGCLENLGKTIGDVVSAFANFDGGHIVVGARDPRAWLPIVPDGDLPRSKGKQGLKEWLETKIYRLSDPPVRNFDVKEFSLAGGNLAVIEIRTSDDAPHQDIESKLFYGRNGSLCYPLSTMQIKDILQRQKTPILEIQELEILKVFTAEKGQHFILFFIIENFGKLVCRTHFVTIRMPLKMRSTPVIIDDEQPPLNGPVSHYVDDKSKSAAYVLELSGGNIYPDQKIRKALRILPISRFDDRLNAICSKTVNNLNITLLSDPPSEVKGQT